MFLIDSLQVLVRPALHRFVSEMSKEIDEWFCETRNIPLSPSQYRRVLPRVAAHISRHWDGIYDYNAWYVWHTAHSMGILNNGLPVSTCSKVNVEQERRQEVLKAGGLAALRTYLSNK